MKRNQEQETDNPNRDPKYWLPFQEHSNRSYRKFSEEHDLALLAPHNIVYEGQALMSALERLANIYFGMWPKGSALDIGCGAGYLTNTLAEIGFSTTGIDSSEEAIDVAKSLYERPQFICDNALKLPKKIREKSYDLIFIANFHPFFRVRDDEFQSAVMQEYLSLLNPGGALVVFQQSTQYDHIDFQRVRDEAKAAGFQVMMPIRYALIKRLGNIGLLSGRPRTKIEARAFSFMGHLASKITKGYSQEIFMAHREVTS